MSSRLRTPFFVIAIILIVITVSVETGSSFLISPPKLNSKLLRTMASEQLAGYDDSKQMTDKLVADSDTAPKPPGLAVSDMALLDGLLVFTVALMAIALFMPERIHGRLQGLATLIVSIIVLIAAIGLAIAAFIKVMIMVALLTATPFGTLAYLAIWGFFNREGASVALSLLLVLKIAFAVFLVLAHQRFLQNKGLVLIIATSLIANVIVTFLHGLVPIFLVSITDAIAAIIVLILAAIWAIFLLIGSLGSIVKAVV